MALLALSLQLFYYRRFQCKVWLCMKIYRFLTTYHIQSWLIDCNYFYFWHHQLVWVNDLSSLKQPSAQTNGLERWVKLYRRCKSSRCTRGRKRWPHWSTTVAGSDLDIWYFKWQVAMCVKCSNLLNLFLWKEGNFGDSTNRLLPSFEHKSPSHIAEFNGFTRFYHPHSSWKQFHCSRGYSILQLKSSFC